MKRIIVGLVALVACLTLAYQPTSTATTTGGDAVAYGDTGVTQRCRNYSRWPGAAVATVCANLRWTATRGGDLRVIRIRILIREAGAFESGTAVWCDELTITGARQPYVWMRHGDGCNISRSVGHRTWEPDRLIVPGTEATLHLLFEPRLDNWRNPQDQSLWFRARIAS